MEDFVPTSLHPHENYPFAPFSFTFLQSLRGGKGWDTVLYPSYEGVVGVWTGTENRPLGLSGVLDEEVFGKKKKSTRPHPDPGLTRFVVILRGESQLPGKRFPCRVLLGRTDSVRTVPFQEGLGGRRRESPSWVRSLVGASLVLGRRVGYTPVRPLSRRSYRTGRSPTHRDCFLVRDKPLG